MTIFYVEKSDFEKYLESGLPPKLFSKEEVSGRLENLKQLKKLNNLFIVEEHFVLMELKPIEKKSFPINIAVFGEKKIGGVSGERLYFATKEEAVLNRLNIDPVWFKILEAIKDMKFAVPISVTLNAGRHFSAIGVERIGDNLFSYVSADLFILSDPEQDFAQIVSSLTDSKIREEFVSGLKRFLKNLPEQKDKRNIYYNTGQRIYATLFCPKPSDIQVAPEEEKQ